MGLVDALEVDRILTFGPVRLAARLESDKEFTRKLLQKHMPSAIPRFDVFEEPQNAIEYAEKLDWEVVRQRGSHIIMTKEGHIATLSVPNHPEVHCLAENSLMRKVKQSRMCLLLWV